MAFVPITFSGDVSAQYRQWCSEALSRMTWDMSFDGGLGFEVTAVDEPPLPGHNEFMCTLNTGDHAVIYIRNNVEDMMQSSMHVGGEDIHKFFMESIVHEYGHVWTFQKLATENNAKSRISNLFRYSVEGSGTARRGTLDDWSGKANWGDNTQEAVAEFFKDLYMPREFRVYDNRTNWQMDKGSFGEWWECVDDAFCYQENAGPVLDG